MSECLAYYISIIATVGGKMNVVPMKSLFLQNEGHCI